MKTGEAILSMLKAYGVTDVFGLPGETTLALYRAWDKFPEIKYHMCRDERNSVFMADAYAKSSGKVGICEGPSVGSPHMIPGMLEAMQSCVPLICFTSDIPLDGFTKNMLTGCDQTALFKGASKATFTANTPHEVPILIRRAFRMATTGRPGPIHIRIPSNVLCGEVADDEVFAQPRFGTFPGCRSVAAKADVEAAAEVIAAAKKPVMVCGQGTIHSGAWEEIQRVAESQKMPVGTTINSKGAFSETHPLSLGVIGARGGRKWSNDMLLDADVVLFAASSTDSAGTGGWKLPSPTSGQKFIQIDAAEQELGNNYNAMPLFGDVKETLAALACALEGKKTPDRSAWAKRVEDGRAEHEKKLAAVVERAKDEIHPLSIARVMEKLAPKDAFFAVDPGISAVYSAGYMKLEKAGRRTAYNFSMGALGYAIPAAIGARFGTSPDQAVIGLIGDGSFGFCAGELETAARLGLNITYVLFNNQTFGWIKGTEYVHRCKDLEPSFGRFTDFAHVDYVKFAEALGLKGYRAETVSEFEKIFAQCLKEKAPCFIDVPVKPEDKQLAPVPSWAASKVAKEEDTVY
jgi:acetolactate synthase-1/2/3 large subunit